MRSSVLFCVAALGLLNQPGMAMANAEPITLVTFDGGERTTHKFRELNDPVMGGQSNGSFTIDHDNSVGILDGFVNIVPKLRAPGFIEAWADDSGFVDASAAIDGDLVLTVKSSTPEYRGFRVSFAAGALSPSFSCAAGGSIIGSGGCYKAQFNVSERSGWTQVRIPFRSFSDKWSSYTGDQVKTCQQDKSVCPTAEKLSKIQAIGFWGEGVEGKVNLQIKSVKAVPAETRAQREVDAPPPKKYDECSSSVQRNLRFNISSLTSKDLTVPVAVDPDESLATAICCDTRTQGYAEPQYLYSSPYVSFFKHVKQTGVTVFYDSVCGVPVFKAPVNRSLASFEADTHSTGWPNFRPEEVIAENVRVSPEGLVISSCGTHLGTYFKQYERYCIDTACIAGSPTQSVLIL